MFFEAFHVSRLPSLPSSPMYAHCSIVGAGERDTHGAGVDQDSHVAGEHRGTRARAANRASCQWNVNQKLLNRGDNDLPRQEESGDTRDGTPVAPFVAGRLRQPCTEYGNRS